ncbi:hypothetical protein F4803DRAFT_264793 [Xylaria telfairii]|nr:hypothetical protein F4803DRAFT_264793 [Xylaria telfairii]
MQNLQSRQSFDADYRTNRVMQYVKAYVAHSKRCTTRHKHISGAIDGEKKNRVKPLSNRIFLPCPVPCPASGRSRREAHARPLIWPAPCVVCQVSHSSASHACRPLTGVQRRACCRATGQLGLGCLPHGYVEESYVGRANPNCNSHRQSNLAERVLLHAASHIHLLHLQHHVVPRSIDFKGQHSCVHFRETSASVAANQDHQAIYDHHWVEAGYGRDQLPRPSAWRLSAGEENLTVLRQYVTSTLHKTIMRTPHSPCGGEGSTHGKFFSMDRAVLAVRTWLT